MSLKSVLGRADLATRHHHDPEDVSSWDEPTLATLPQMPANRGISSYPRGVSVCAEARGFPYGRGPCRSLAVVVWLFTASAAWAQDVPVEADDEEAAADDEATAGESTAGESTASEESEALTPEEAVAKAEEDARAMFEQGLEFVEMEDWANAEDRFRRVLQTRSSHVVSYNLASALVHLDRFTEAAELLRAIVRDPSVPPQIHASAQQLLRETEPRIGSITIRLSGDLSDCEVVLDDKPLPGGHAIHAVSVDPGEHAVRIRRAGAIVIGRAVTVGGSEPLRVEVALDIPPRRGLRPARADAAGAITPPFAGAHTVPAEDTGVAPWWVWAGVGVAVVGGVIAIAIVAGGDSEEAAPVAGDTDPPVVRGIVMGMP
jgi:hypothetical protein